MSTNPRTGKRHWYSPSSKIQKAIGLLALVARQEAQASILGGDCALHLTCYGFAGKDLDNAVKLCLDSLNGVLWNDDDQVHLIIARKIAVGTPRMEVEVEAL